MSSKFYFHFFWVYTQQHILLDPMIILFSVLLDTTILPSRMAAFYVEFLHQNEYLKICDTE